MYEGSRGGLYYIRKGRKVYVNKFGNAPPPVQTDNEEEIRK